jgi:hypothetical protein
MDLVGAPNKEPAPEGVCSLDKQALALERPRGANAARFGLIHPVRLTQVVGRERAGLVPPCLHLSRCRQDTNR